MRLVLDCRSIHKHMGGIGRVTLDLATYLYKMAKDHEITLLLGADVPPELTLPDVRLVQVEAAMIDERFEQLGLPGVLENLQAEAYFNPCFTLPALKTTRYQLAMIHDVVFEDHPEWVAPSLRDYLQCWARFSATHADRIVTVSDHAKDRIAKVYGLAPERIVRVYNGIRPECFVVPGAERIQALCAKYALKGRYLLYLGTLERKKGTLDLLGASERLVKNGFEGDLVLAGGTGGPEVNWDERIQASSCPGRIKRVGYVPEAEKAALLGSCAVFVYPSLYEGFGLPPLEALALGRPCVVSASTSLPEVVGPHAILADVAHEEAFAGALERALEDVAFRERTGKEGPAWAARFSWERAAAQVLEVCESLSAA